MPEYGVRFYMNYDVRPTEQWTLNLEYDVADVIESALITNISDGIADGLSLFELNNVVIDRAVWYTWEPDSSPYDPTTVRTIPYGIMGQRVIGGLDSPVDDDLVIFLRKTVTSGRSGKIQLRGRLRLSDLIAESGSWALNPLVLADYVTDVANLWNDISQYAAPSLIGAALTGITYPATPEGVKQVPIKVYAATPTVRAVTDLVLVGPTERQDTQN